VPRDITPLVRALEQTTPGVQADVYQLLAAWNTSIEAAMESGPGRTESVMQQYHEEVVSLTDAAATDGQVDWDFLAECCDAYPPRTGDHACSSILVNVVTRCVIRTRLDDGVEAIPPWALDYLAAITEDNDGLGNKIEAAAFGWGIGHPQIAVADRTLDRAANGDERWAMDVLGHATLSDQDAGIDLFERLVQSAKTSEPLQFLEPLDTIRDRDQPLLPEYWEPADDREWQTELSADNRDRILGIVGDTVSAAQLMRADHRFGFDLRRAADEVFRSNVPNSVPDSMLHVGKHRGGKWHLLGDAGCPDGDPEQVATVEPFFECRYRIDTAVPGGQISLNPNNNRGEDMCRRCFDTVSDWDYNRYDYVATREKEYDGGTRVTWTPLDEDRWVRACDICLKPAGATHAESTFDQRACPSCLRDLSRAMAKGLQPAHEDSQTPLTLEEILTGPVETRAIPSWETQQKRARERRQEHNREREHLPLTHTGIPEGEVNILREHGYETVADLCDADPAVLADIPGLGRRWQPQRLPHEYTISLGAFDGIGSTIASRLEDQGYGTLPALEAASIDELARIRGMSEAKAERICHTIQSW